MAVFNRNLTSELIEKQVDLIIDTDKRLTILELGCGDGNISRSLSKKFPQHSYYASDISEEAIQTARQQDLSNTISFRHGGLFEPWSNEMFDVIISDVASISEAIANLSDWYAGIPCKTGQSGLDLVSSVIGQARLHLPAGGVFVMPILSLSNFREQIGLLKSTFDLVEIKAETNWPMPTDLLDLMVSRGMVFECDNWCIVKKYGLGTAWTSVAECRFL
jgi:SAM-dependent methyltransferase